MSAKHTFLSNRLSIMPVQVLRPILRRDSNPPRYGGEMPIEPASESSMAVANTRVRHDGLTGAVEPKGSSESQPMVNRLPSKNFSVQSGYEVVET
jgi:hypothetical protein